MSKLQKGLDAAQYRVLFTVPFFAPGVARLPVKWDKSIPTACTDGKEILYNPDFFAKFDPKRENVTVLCEEVGHCLLGHHWRAPNHADWELWNVACDAEVRWMMKDFSDQVMAKGQVDPFPFPAGTEPEPQFRNMSAEQVYRIMAGKRTHGANAGNQQGPAPRDGRATGNQARNQGDTSQGQSGANKAQSTNGTKQSRSEQCLPPEFGEMKRPSGSKDEQANQKTQWDAALMQSATVAKSQGILPGSLDRYVKELIHPPIPWIEIVRSWLAEQHNDDWNWMKPNPFLSSSEFILPSLDNERMGTPVFAIDTSGSIDQRLLSEFKGIEQDTLDTFKPVSLVELCCDRKMHSARTFHPGDEIPLDASGGGGTSFQPVFEHCAGMAKPPKCLIYLTDLDGKFPDEEPPFPVLWVVWGGKTAAPFGTVVQASPER